MSAQCVGVVGLGLLGRGIATCLLSRNVRVSACDSQEETRHEAREHIEHCIEDLIQRGGFPEALRAEWRDRYQETSNPAELSECDFIIESIFEDLEAKTKLYKALEGTVGTAVPIASNTSAIPISVLQRNLEHPGRLVGMHWAEPCHLTRFLEVIRGEQTNDATVEAALALGRLAGKDSSLVQKDMDGFIVNRLGYALYREAFWLLENGVADVETIDRSFRNAISVWGDIAGPFRWMDLTGLPAYAAVMERLFPKLSTSREVPALMRELVESGATGIGNGRGFYKYTPEEAAAWERRLIEHAWRIREITRDLPDSEQR